jgi:hypothetical protein
MARLIEYPWPGNIRELKNAIERAMILSESNRIELSDLPAGAGSATTGLTFAAPGPQPLSLREAEKRQILLALEQEQQRVTAELEQHAVALAGAVEHAAEDAAQGLDQLLAADPAALRETFGERGEAGDVGKAQRAVNRLPQPFGRRAAQPGMMRDRVMTRQPVVERKRGGCGSRSGRH